MSSRAQYCPAQWYCANHHTLTDTHYECKLFNPTQNMHLQDARARSLRAALGLVRAARRLQAQRRRDWAKKGASTGRPRQREPSYLCTSMCLGRARMPRRLNLLSQPSIIAALAHARAITTRFDAILHKSNPINRHARRTTARIAQYKSICADPTAFLANRDKAPRGLLMLKSSRACARARARSLARR